MRPGFFRYSILVMATSIVAFVALTSQWNSGSIVSAQNQKITQGTLQAFDPVGNVKAVCPLKHTDVKAQISGFLSRVTVTQEFENPFKEKIEAVYVDVRDQKNCPENAEATL